MHKLTVYAASEAVQGLGAKHAVSRQVWVKIGGHQTPEGSHQQHQFLPANPLLLHRILRGNTIFRLEKNLSSEPSFLQAYVLVGRPKTC